MTKSSELPSRQSHRAFALIPSVSVALLGVLALAGWVFHVEALKSIIPGADPIKPNMATGMLLCGAALSILARKTLTRPIRNCTAAIAITVIILSALTVGEYLLGFNLGIEHWLIGEVPAASGISRPGRMSPLTAVCFILVGVALFTASQQIQKRSRLPLVGGLGGTLTAAGAVPLIGFLLEMLFGPSWNYMGVTSSGLAGAIAFLLFGIGLLALLRSHAQLTWSLDRVTTAGFASGFALMVIAAGLTYTFTVKMQQTAMQVSRAQEIRRELNQTEESLSDLELEQRSYIITANERLLDEWDAKESEIRDHFRKLQKLELGNSGQQPVLRQFGGLVGKRINWAKQTIETRRERGFTAAQEMIAAGPGVDLLEQSRGLIQAIASDGAARLRENQTQSDLASRAVFMMLPLGVFVCFAIIFLGVFFLNSGMGERKIAERELRESEERMRAILNSALDCVITMDHQGKVIEFNPAAEKTFGYRRDEAIGQLLSQLIIPPALRERHQKGLSHYLATGEAHVLGKRLEMAAVRRDGSEFPIELAITRIGSQVPPMFTGFIRDITERQQAEEALKDAEEKYRSIFENSNEGIFQNTPAGRFLSANPALARMLGFDSPEELMRARNDIERQGYTDPAMRDKFKRALEENGFVTGFEYEVYRKDGTKIWISENSRIVRDAEGRPFYYEGSVQDITDRKHADELLRASEERYRSLFESNPNPMWVYDVETLSFLAVNSTAVGHYGYSQDEFLAMTIKDIRPAEDIPVLMDELSKANGDAKNPIQWRHCRKDRAMIDVEITSHDVTWLGRRAKLALINDITERKKAEGTLREQAALFDQTYDAVLVWDWDGLITFWNHGAENLYGYSRAAAVGRTSHQLLHTQIAAGLQTVIQSLDRHGVWEGELEHTTSDGRQITVESRMVLVREPKREYVLEINRDITERKRGQERLLEQADIINRAQDAIVIRNFEDQRITFWNKGAEHLYGWSAEEAIGRPVVEVMFANEKEREAPLKILTSTGEFHGETTQVAKDGRKLVVDSRATLIRNRNETPRSVLLINTDVTEQKKLETHLLRAQRLESIGTLASGVAHDLNNILTPILICAEVLKGSPAPEDIPALISTIEESAKRGANVVKQVLTFARGIEGERVVIKPSHLIQEMIDVARSTFPKTIEIVGRYTSDLWSIKCDPTQLHQVLLNLSVNARDVMPDGGLITIRAENFEVDEHYASMTPGAKPGPHVMFRVTDTGTGMSRATMEKIFDPFFTTKEVGKGTGLGLSSALGIVKSHGGFISVSSEIGTGTTFKFFLPATVGEKISRESKTPELLRGSDELVLVVDDEPDIVRITKMILEKHNYRVLTAEDGPGALALIAQQAEPIEVVITDMSMPFMDGVALIRAIRKMKPATTFVASTGQGEETHVAELESLGVSTFLTKPYDTDTLLTAIRDTLKGAPSNAVQLC